MSQPVAGPRTYRPRRTPPPDPGDSGTEKVKSACRAGPPVGSCGWARVTDVAKCRRQGLVVCRAALPFEGLCDARPGVALAPALIGRRLASRRSVRRVGALGLAGEVALGVADRACCAIQTPRPALARRGAPAVSSSRRSFLARQRGLAEGVVLLAGEQAPEQAGELARGGDDRDLVAAAGADALVEGAQRPGLRGPRSSSASTSACRTAAEPCLEMRPWRGGRVAGLADARVQAEVADQLARARGSGGCRRPPP